MQELEAEIEQIWRNVTTDERFSEMIDDILKGLLDFKETNSCREEVKVHYDKKHDEISELTTMI